MSEKKLELYKQFQSQYCNMLSMVSAAYNKALIGLSTTTIGFTFAVLKFAENAGQHIQDVRVLKTSWIFLTVTILLILFSFIATQQHAQHRIRFINSVIDEKYDVQYQHTSDWIMYWSGLLAGMSFFIGIVCFALFCWANIS